MNVELSLLGCEAFSGNPSAQLFLRPSDNLRPGVGSEGDGTTSLWLLNKLISILFADLNLLNSSSRTLLWRARTLFLFSSVDG
jgi:hypothetical protein